MKRILIVQYSSNLDGSSFSALLLATGFQRAGWETHVVFGSNGPIISNFLEQRHQTYIFPHKNWLRRSNVIRFAKDSFQESRNGYHFRDLIREINPQVVYINTTTGLFAAIAANLQQIPVIWHLRELYESVGGEMKCPTGAKSLISKMIREMADQVVSNAKAVADNMLGEKHGRDSLIVPNAVDSHFFNPMVSKEEARITLGLESGSQLVIGIPGTPRPMKGHDFFIQSMASYLKDHREFKVIISGEGDEHYCMRLKRLIGSLNIENQVVFTGMIRDMTLFYKSCDLVVVPSRAEPFGRVIIEAFACKIPVIATRVGGIPEIIRDKQNGRLVPYGDQAKLKETVIELIENQALRTSLAESAYQDALENYTEELYQNRLIKIVENNS